jgi:hypothetical protein
MAYIGAKLQSTQLLSLTARSLGVFNLFSPFLQELYVVIHKVAGTACRRTNEFLALTLINCAIETDVSKTECKLIEQRRSETQYKNLFLKREKTSNETH